MKHIRLLSSSLLPIMRNIMIAKTVVGYSTSFLEFIIISKIMNEQVKK